jgi:hypothetical protein
MPDWAVPSQYASTSSWVMPAAAKASFDASRARSSTPLSQASVKGVHPIPTMATRSLMPWLPIGQASVTLVVLVAVASPVVAPPRTGRAFQK